MVPLNLLPTGGTAAYVVTGAWGQRAVAEATALAATRGGEARMVANTVPGKGDVSPRRLPRNGEARSAVGDRYLHLTTNETIDGVQFATAPGSTMPDFGPAPVVADMSSDIAWRRVDVRQFGVAYAGAQKNLGPSGVTVVIIRRDLVEVGRADIPTIFQYRTFAKHDSLYNTPPTFAIYLMGLVLEWMEGIGGLDVIEARNRAKAAAIYDAIDAAPGFYRCPVEFGSRSLMNVTFRLPTPESEVRFLGEASAHGMTGLAGHRSAGGIRASLYNAVEPAWAEALAALMRDHAARYG
jgi:phosphoserine aminotransferase